MRPGTSLTSPQLGEKLRSKEHCHRRFARGRLGIYSALGWFTNGIVYNPRKAAGRSLKEMRRSSRGRSTAPSDAIVRRNAGAGFSGCGGSSERRRDFNDGVAERFQAAELLGRICFGRNAHCGNAVRRFGPLEANDVAHASVSGKIEALNRAKGGLDRGLRQWRLTQDAGGGLKVMPLPMAGGKIRNLLMPAAWARKLQQIWGFSSGGCPIRRV